MRTGLLVLILLAAPAAATAADNPLLAAQARGYTLAAGVCAACHMIEPAGTSPNPRAPPFRILAGRYVPSPCSAGWPISPRPDTTPCRRSTFTPTRCRTWWPISTAWNDPPTRIRATGDGSISSQDEQ
uniref:Cytochrome c domain-containing protein n=1 Tax=Phenylobacterium glaciei TaxID=2803784 RepID=A0A974P2Y7_9CAUL|nr:hypothetical protein JKL49_20840 [Phenylobacterium glaciei]